jgi:hypothetical protein
MWLGKGNFLSVSSGESSRVLATVCVNSGRGVLFQQQPLSAAVTTPGTHLSFPARQSETLTIKIWRAGGGLSSPGSRRHGGGGAPLSAGRSTTEVPPASGSVPVRLH